MTNISPHLAVFVDIENLDRPQSLNFEALLEYLRSRGWVTVCRAYADWTQTPDIRRLLIQAGIELVDMAALNGHGKNATDIRVAVDAIELAHTQPRIDNFVLVSGDSDFVPLIVRLRSYQKQVTLIADSHKAARAAKSFCDEVVDFQSIPGFVHASLSKPKALSTSAETNIPSTEVLATIVSEVQADQGADMSVIRAAWRRQVDATSPATVFQRLMRQCLIEGHIQPHGSRSDVIRFRRTPRHERKTAAMVHKLLTESAYRLLQRVILHQLASDSNTCWGHLKPVVKRINPRFHESRLGFLQFGEFIQAAHDAGYIEANAANSAERVTLPKSAEATASECARWYLQRCIPRDPWAAVSVMMSVEGIVLQTPELQGALLRAVHDSLRGIPTGLQRGELQNVVRQGFFQDAEALNWRRTFAELLHGLVQLDMLDELRSAQFRLPAPDIGFEEWRQPLNELMSRSVHNLDVAMTRADWESLQLPEARKAEQAMHHDAPQQRTFEFCSQREEPRLEKLRHDE